MNASDNDLILFSMCAGGFISYEAALKRADSRAHLDQLLSLTRRPPWSGEGGVESWPEPRPRNPRPTFGAEARTEQ
jgi:hypothetical protein